MKNKIIITAWLVLLFLAASVSAQSGGNFEITESVIAGGGGQQSTGGNFALDGTIGQSAAGNALSNTPFTVTSGFWNFTPLAPSAATVGVGGRIITAQGNGIRNVIVTLTDSGGASRTTRTSAFGYFKFDDVEVGGAYIISVFAKRYGFNQPTILRTVFEEIGDLEFIANDL